LLEVQSNPIGVLWSIIRIAYIFVYVFVYTLYKVQECTADCEAASSTSALWSEIYRVYNKQFQQKLGTTVPCLLQHA